GGRAVPARPTSREHVTSDRCQDEETDRADKHRDNVRDGQPAHVPWPGNSLLFTRGADRVAVLIHVRISSRSIPPSCRGHLQNQDRRNFTWGSAQLLPAVNGLRLLSTMFESIHSPPPGRPTCPERFDRSAWRLVPAIGR